MSFPDLLVNLFRIVQLGRNLSSSFSYKYLPEHQVGHLPCPLTVLAAAVDEEPLELTAEDAAAGKVLLEAWKERYIPT